LVLSEWAFAAVVAASPGTAMVRNPCLMITDPLFCAARARNFWMMLSMVTNSTSKGFPFSRQKGLGRAVLNYWILEASD
jgi:hypothetical protein